jgi:peptidyl-prolyl cis-trans isomerase SurA
MKNLLTAFALLMAFSSSAQTLFTYGSQSVSANEFIRAFKKNNNGASDEKALKEYLDLYIASRLKIREAKDMRYDTLPQLVTDLGNLRQQILPSYVNDKESLNKLVSEAFTRSQKDIHVAHIFIAFTKNGATDVASADSKRNEVIDKLNKGVKFEELAKQYSDDPSVLNNSGDLGWITVFSLPYELENLAYNTGAGKTSAVHTSKIGYHTFKNLGERKAAGRLKASQILLALPPGSDETSKARLKKTADSIYGRLQAGEDFGKLATAFSNDVISAASNGQMQEFGVGEFNPAFENTAFALQRDGAITKPFFTEHGYHIVKRISISRIGAKLNQDITDDLRRKIESSDRIFTTKNVLAKRVMREAGYKKLLPSDEQLWAFSDSAFTGIKPAMQLTVQPLTPLMKIGNHTALVKDWILFAQVHRYRSNGNGVKPYSQVWDEFVQATTLNYYEQHLEDFNEDFRRQITEFAEGNLFFEIMQRKVWSPAQNDTIALADYYQKHKAQYVWKASADAVIFYAADEKKGNEFFNALRKNPANWKSVAGNYSEQITTDSGRFELTQIPKAEKEVLTKGLVTSPVVNKGDNTSSFAYILQIHTKAEPRSFTDAKGLVINDYQAELEKEWITELKKKYPVTVNENVWKELVKKNTSQ